MRELVRLTKGDVDLVIAGRRQVSLCVIWAEGACCIQWRVTKPRSIGIGSRSRSR